MPGAAIERRRSAEWAIGFYGKLPARGDFVQAGLPRDFVGAWDGWIASVLPCARERLGAAWIASWMEAPIWRFLLAPGLCGGHAVVGLWMPSVDAVGRAFPLVLAACAAPDDPWEEDRARAFLATAKHVGLEALEGRIEPEAIVDRLRGEQRGRTDIPAPPDDGAIWWTEGAPLVDPTLRRSSRLPEAEMFASMLSDRVSA